VDLRGWDERYRTSEPATAGPPTPLLARTAAGLRPGRVLDLACGAGRNAVWLAQNGWSVTAVDGSRAAIEIVRRREPAIDARVADLEKNEYAIEADSWDLIAMCYYLQRDLFEPARRGVAAGGVVLAIVHIPEPGSEPSRFSLLPGELRNYFQGWEILHSYEGPLEDPEHKRWVAEIVARRDQ
jgi:tellurite methyltransferase